MEKLLLIKSFCRFMFSFLLSFYIYKQAINISDTFIEVYEGKMIRDVYQSQ